MSLGLDLGWIPGSREANASNKSWESGFDSIKAGPALDHEEFGSNRSNSNILRSGMRAENRYTLSSSRSSARHRFAGAACACGRRGARKIFVAKQAVIGLSGLTLPGSMA
jgi:hypothetical protein